MPIVIIFLFVLFLTSASQLEVTQDATRQERTAETRHGQTVALAQLVNRFLDEQGAVPPASLAVIAATPGYEEARQYLNNGDGPFYVAYPMNGGTYHRVIVYSPPIDGSLTATTYLQAANNACGSTDPSQSAAWCGNSKGSYWITETSNRISREMLRERIQQQQTLKKFAAIYSINQIYPDSGAGEGTAVKLLDLLTTPPASAATCTGVWQANNAVKLTGACQRTSANGTLTCIQQWKDIPLSCDDLYTIWGTARSYNFISKDYIALYGEAPWIDTDGKTIAIASQLDSRNP